MASVHEECTLLWKVNLQTAVSTSASAWASSSLQNTRSTQPSLRSSNSTALSFTSSKLARSKDTCKAHTQSDVIVSGKFNILELPGRLPYQCSCLPGGCHGSLCQLRPVHRIALAMQQTAARQEVAPQLTDRLQL